MRRRCNIKEFQYARATGAKWYYSYHHCGAGHERPRRRVSDDSCLECSPLGSQAADLEKTIPELYPNGIISRDDARSIGLVWFRTGQPCEGGHTGWRYVSSGVCCQCVKVR